MKKAEVKTFGQYDFGGEFGIWTDSKGKVYLLMEDPWYDFDYADPSLDLYPIVTVRAKNPTNDDEWFLSFNISDSCIDWLGDDAKTWNVKNSDFDCDDIDWAGCIDIVPVEY